MLHQEQVLQAVANAQESLQPGDFCDSAVVFREICRPNLANGILVDPSSTKGFVVDLRQFVHGNFRYLLKSYQVKCLEMFGVTLVNKLYSRAQV